MKNYQGFKSSGILAALLGVFSTLSGQAFGPVMVAMGIIIAAFFIFKDKKQNTTFGLIMAITLALMLAVEYFLLPMQNTIFYVLLVIMSLGTFLTFYFALKPQNLLTREEKILSWTGVNLFGISLFGIMGIIFNNFSFSLIIGAFALIMLVVGRLMRRRISQEDAFKDEFDKEYITGNPEDYWFNYKIGGGMPKPLRWQGWACYALIFVSPIVALIFARDPTTAVAIIVASIFVVIVIAMWKSNYRESVREHRENLKKES